ncbi:MAG: UbiA family prenyltransferase [Lentimicrobium sp.]|nr:UbiA family prenyltransferase [Lentimicrobium sp.]
MKGLYEDFLRVLLHSNLIIAFAAVSLSLVTQIQLGFSPQFHAFHLLIFSACIAEYNLHRLLKFYAINQNSRHDNYNWLSENLLFSWLFTLASLIILLISFLFVSAGVKWIFLGSGLIALLYSLPGKGWAAGFSLRKVPYLKTFLVALVWTSITVLIPATEFTVEAGANLMLIFAGRFLFVFSLALLFDIRDIEADRSAGIKTIPGMLGKAKTLELFAVLLFLFPLISLILSGFSGYYFLSASALMISVYLELVVNCRSCRNSAFYYPVFLDGSMILYSLMVITGWLIFH